MSVPQPAANALFRQYLSAPEAGEDPEDLLAQLIVEYAQPLVGRVVRRRLGASRGVNQQDVEDVANEALLTLVTRLRAMRDDSAASRVEDFDSYAVGLASHVAFQFFASRFPERSRLRARIRYVLSTDARFATRRADYGACLCALAERIGGSPAAGATVEAVRAGLARRELTSRRLGEVLLTALSEFDGAIELGDLTTLVAGLLGVDDRNDNTENLAETVADPRVSQERDLELRRSLAMLWEDIRELPQGQRVALLLNLRSTNGACIWLLPELGVVGFRDLADALGMRAEELAGIWNRLPLGDAEIAERLSLERQQIINMRSAARQRLTRRTKIRDRTVAAINMPGNSTTN
ncbi:MAG: hypothetical protein JSU00_30890 [Acidobacteria bacterium]|nr:hypothetical protein [Acidobacteriota bacterium]